MKYRMGLIRLKQMGLERVFSYTLGKEAGVSAELVRKDFSNFGIKGNRRGGYEIDDLLSSVEKIFGKDRVQNVVIMGMGNMGKALSHYRGFPDNNMNIVAGFDIDPAKINKKFHIPIYPVDNLKEIIDAFHVSVAILAVPEIAAQETCDLLVRSGIKGILNLAPVLLKVPDDVFVNNVNLMVELERLMYHSGVLK
ncbi:MAG: redox-sensing transcriptional repressor Rex [Bacteroidales bacterium]|nr:redox-sensing transcriptional repressor Rex [Bacteroidales bacterium]MBS3775337.1 redox-sensing transcriptional repressor Rex [Bacteroidales bacterium]